MVSSVEGYLVFLLLCLRLLLLRGEFEGEILKSGVSFKNENIVGLLTNFILKWMDLIDCTKSDYGKLTLCKSKSRYHILLKELGGEVGHERIKRNSLVRGKDGEISQTTTFGDSIQLTHALTLSKVFKCSLHVSLESCLFCSFRCMEQTNA